MAEAIVGAIITDIVGELVTGVVKRAERGNIYVDLGGNAEAFIPKDKGIPRDVLRAGDRVRGYLFDVRTEPRGPQLFISRAAPEFMMELFRLEVPEVGQGLVEISVEILEILDAGREPQEIRRARGIRPLHRGPVLDQALDAAERRRPLPQPNPRRRGNRRRLAVPHPDRQHETEAALHLPGRHRMAGIVRQAGIEDPRDMRMPLEPRGENRRAGRLRRRPQVERAQGAHQQVGLERPEDAAAAGARGVERQVERHHHLAGPAGRAGIALVAAAREDAGQVGAAGEQQRVGATEAAAIAPVPPGSAVPAAVPQGAAVPATKPRLSGCAIAMLAALGIMLLIGLPAIGILAAIAIPAYQGYAVRSKIAQASAATVPIQRVGRSRRAAAPTRARGHRWRGPAGLRPRHGR